MRIRQTLRTCTATLALGAAAQFAPAFAQGVTPAVQAETGMLRSPHTLDIKLMFYNAARSAALVGSGEVPARMAEMMSDAWIAFARTGVPASDLLPEWRPYTASSRMVMDFDLEPLMVDDPEAAIRAIGR